MKIGALCYNSSNGLSYQTKAIKDNLPVSKVMLVDLSHLNGMPLHTDWYEPDIITHGFPTNQQIRHFLRGLDVVWVCENPLNYYLFQFARENGIKAIQQPNYEFLEYQRYTPLPKPSRLALPSPWNLETIEALNIAPITYLPLPVDTSRLPQRTITEAKTFFHVAGRPAHLDRNGTLTFIQATKLLPRMNAQFLLYCQAPNKDITNAIRGSRVQIITDVEDNAQLYERGDVHILPRKYGGLCLPLNESLGAGIPTIMPDIDPNNRWLPPNWLVPTTGKVQQFRAKSDVTVHEVSPRVLAQKMFDLYRQPETVRQMHEEAKALGKEISWDNMRSKYMEFINEVVHKSP